MPRDASLHKDGIQIASTRVNEHSRMSNILLSHGALGTKERLPILKLWGGQLAYALFRLHEKGICLRSMCAENVAISRTGDKVSIASLGAAVCIDDAEDVAIGIMGSKCNALQPSVVKESAPSLEMADDIFSFGKFLMRCICDSSKDASDVADAVHHNSNDGAASSYLAALNKVPRSEQLNNAPQTFGAQKREAHTLRKAVKNRVFGSSSFENESKAMAETKLLLRTLVEARTSRKHARGATTDSFLSSAKDLFEGLRPGDDGCVATAKIDGLLRRYLQLPIFFRADRGTALED